MTKDFRAAGLSSLKEELYSPTASLEALRTCLAFGETFQLDVLSMDVSVAFMNAPIPEENCSFPVLRFGSESFSL